MLILQTETEKFMGKNAEQKMTLKVNEKLTTKQKISVSNPRLWSLEDFYLYKVYGGKRKRKRNPSLNKRDWALEL